MKTTQYSYTQTFKTNNFNPNTCDFDIDTKNYDKKINFENSNLYFYRNNLNSNDNEFEFKNRYDNQLNKNTSLIKRISELEIELENEKTRYNELKDKLENELQNERNLRKNLELKLNDKINEYIKNEINLKNEIIVNEKKLSEVNIKYKDYEKEIEKLQNENLNLKNMLNNSEKNFNSNLANSEKLLMKKIKKFKLIKML